VNLLYNVCTYYRNYHNYSSPINIYPTLQWHVIHIIFFNGFSVVTEMATAANSRPAGSGVVVSTLEPTARDGRPTALSSSSLQESYPTSPTRARSRPGRRGAPTGRVPPQTIASAGAETGKAIPRLRSWVPMGEPMALCLRHVLLINDISLGCDNLRQNPYLLPRIFRPTSPCPLLHLLCWPSTLVQLRIQQEPG